MVSNPVVPLQRVVAGRRDDDILIESKSSRRAVRKRTEAAGEGRQWSIGAGRVDGAIIDDKSDATRTLRGPARQTPYLEPAIDDEARWHGNARRRLFPP